jgi:hypothetical protein
MREATIHTMPRVSHYLALIVFVSQAACQGALESPSKPGDSFDGSGDPPKAAVCGAGDQPAGMTAPLRVLTPVQYHNSVRDLFDGKVTPSTQYPRASGVAVTGYSTDLALQALSAGFAEGVANAADEVALQVIGNVADLLPCAATGPNTACADDFIKNYAAKAFRRPLAETERSALLAQFDAAYGEHKNFPAAIAEVSSSILQHPQFIYLPEIGKLENGRRFLDDYEIGTRLSFLFWDSPPDAEILRAAAAGELTKIEGVKAQTKRMIKDPKFEAVIKRFTAEWLHFKGIIVATKDPMLFPELDETLAKSMAEELDRFVIDAVRKGKGGFEALVSGRDTFVNAPLAELYGAAAPGATDATWVKVTLPRGRSGILTRPAVLAGFAGPTEASHIRRGAFVLKGMLCAPIGNPPPDAEASQPAYPEGASRRERSTILQKTAPCGGCHTQIDPIGLALDDFDALGKKLSEEADVSGRITIDGKVHDFHGSSELADLLVESKQAQDCVARQWFRYTFGRNELSADACTYATLSDDLGRTEGDLASMFAAVALSDGFRHRTTKED